MIEIEDTMDSAGASGFEAIDYKRVDLLPPREQRQLSYPPAPPTPLDETGERMI
jgi:hypothetical protein